MLESAPGFLTSSTYRRSLLQRSSRLAGAALFAAILVACGGSDGDGGRGDDPGVNVEPQQDLLTSFKQQTLNWQACDLSAMENEGDNQDLVQLGERAQCALMRVPLDYANPSSAELQIEVLKVAAEQPLQKLGAIVFNPGGPGADGQSVAVTVSWQLSRSGPGAVAELREMSRRYDLVGFAPRGTGRHSPLNCTPAESLAPMNPFLLDPNPENFSAIQRNARVFAEGCAANPLTRHIHTDATARDMDLLRGLLGEEKLNYIGYSYGTWLGSWYAGLFPERVGRMLLDSSMDITANFDETFLSMDSAEQRLIDEVLLPHAASHPDRFGLGTDATALRNRLLALSARVKHALVDGWNPDGSGQRDRNVFALAAALGVQDLLTQKPQASVNDLLAEIATSSAFGTPQVAEQARWLSGQLFATRDVDRPEEDGPVYWSVRCNDSRTLATAGTYQSWSVLAQDFAARYPLVQEPFPYDPCLYWSGSAQKMPAAAEVGKAGPLLMLQSRYDVLTPVDGAQKTWAALPNAHMIVVENEYQHSIFPYGTACVDRQVANYFLHGQLPARLSSCAGQELDVDEGEDGDDA